MSDIRGLVDALVSGDSLSIESSFDDVMSQKISVALDNRKMELAQSMFGTPQSAETEDTIEVEAQDQEVEAE